MTRFEMINIVGSQYNTENIENGEFSYAVALGGVANLANPTHYKLDIRFYDEATKTAVLIETKPRFRKTDEPQLFAYISNEQKLNPAANIIAMLANTANNKIKVWKIVGDKIELLSDRAIKTMPEYVRYFVKRNKNDKTTVLENTSQLNRILHDNGIEEKLRSQFVGTCLLALKNGLAYQGLETEQIIAGIKSKLNGLLGDDAQRAQKIALLDSKVLTNQNVRTMQSGNFIKLLNFINENILPYIDAESHEGQDILSYFFTTFNKYVAREDKNQAFTPNHIAHFMSQIGGIHKTTRVFDPTCGSGTFLVQTLSQELKLCETDAEREDVKKKHIFGIEFDENVFGLSTTNMLIHGDGNSNIYCASCFDMEQWIKDARIDLVLMNPPYNAARSKVNRETAALFGTSTTDPTKGLSFVHYIAECTKDQKGRLVTLLPMACAIATRSGIIMDFKEKMLEHHTLDAVFSFPDEMFYPGASAVACCMVFDLGKPHPAEHETFFGYFKCDGFEKRKGVGRVDIKNKWAEIEAEWLRLYLHRESKAGYSITKHVEASDEWCAEAYMETDYSVLSDEIFIRTIQSYASYRVLSVAPSMAKYSSMNFGNSNSLETKPYSLEDVSWDYVKLSDLFTSIYKANPHVKANLTICEFAFENSVPFISRTESNNGCDGYVNADDVFVEEGNAIIIGDTTASVFYQPISFTTGDHIIVCRCSNLNKYNSLFLRTVLSLEKYRFNYGRAFKRDIVINHKIKLPVKSDGSPDWDFMEKYLST